MKTFKYTDKNFEKIITNLNKPQTDQNEEFEKIVRDILFNVRKKGDKAVFEYTKRFDNFNINSGNIKVTAKEIKDAYKNVDKKNVNALKNASARIKAFHKKQLVKSFKYKDDFGSTLGQVVTPIEKVGIYVPGGLAAYPSSVLMNAIPAKIAGVKDIYMCSPTPNGVVNPYVLVAADICGVSEIFKVGGAQAVGAMAYGTDIITKVDKIVGPGNIFVAIAKKLVFGEVDIDMIAGPSEILVIADSTANPKFVASDLLSQAEHDELASTTLVTTSAKIAEETKDQLIKQTAKLSRKKIIEKSLKNLNIFIIKDLIEAAKISNIIAPEHLELSVSKPFELLKKIKNAGSIFLGHFTPESIGDYMAGPNHVLPTGGTARFFSPLGVYDFQKRTSIISFSKKGFLKVCDDVDRIATLEGLDAHARAVTIRK